MTAEHKIPDDMFDETALKSQKFLGKVVESIVREGTIGQLAGSTIWYLEVENYSRQMTFNFNKEILPLKGMNSLWTKEVIAFKNNVAYPINMDSIPKLKGKFFWFEVSDLTRVDKDGVEKTITRNFFWPVAAPTQEDINSAIALREGGEATQPAEAAVPAKEAPIEPGQIDATILAVMDGLTHDELVSTLEGIDEMKPYMEDVKSKKIIARLIAQNKVGVRDNKYFLK